jgi:hypothetical protein
MSDVDFRRFRARKPVTTLHLAYDSNATTGPPLFDGVTLLILGGSRAALHDYRTWAAEGGGIGLQVGSDDALTNWLARHHFVRTAVLIDDDSLPAMSGLALAATIRRIRPDVPVLLLLPPDAPELSPATPGPSFAIDRRPLTRSGFTRAMEMAILLVGVDREFFGAEHIAPPRLTRPFDADEVPPGNAPWLVPMLLGGILAWVLIAMAIF